MERLTLDDMIKALKCVASQDTEGDCYADRENFMHMEDDEHKRLVCGTGENLRDFISGREAVGCPYYQKKYGYCFEDGELSWLKGVAELLEELKTYKDIGTPKDLKELKENGAFTGLELAKLAIMQKELKKYKDAEEHGLLVRLPCKVGDDLYCIVNGEVKKLKVHSFGVPDFEITDIEFKYVDGFKIVRFVGEIGKTVFLTHEEAEKKLEEMQNDKR